VLGATLAEIAREKAAIIRSGVAVTCAQAPEAAAVLEARAAAMGVPLWTAGRDLWVTVAEATLEGQRISCGGRDWQISDLDLPLLGTYQPENALLAVAAARALGVPEAAVRAGLAVVQWPGRFHVLGGGPRLVLDGAHNAGGARALAASLAAYFPGERPTFVVGIYRDKDAPGILGALVPLAGRLIVTASSNPRAASPATLAETARAWGATAEIAPTVADALRLASTPARPPVVCVTGSLSLIGEALAHLGGDKPCPVEKGVGSMSFPG
jgi:dihydrofolate synthase/folylpolyglutamate synthase